jgi:MYXO-CTERM domain-containing protein
MGGVMGTGGLTGAGGGAAGGKAGAIDAGVGGSRDATVDVQSSDVRIDVSKPGGGCNCAVSGSGAFGPAGSLGFAALLGLLWWRRRRNRR